MRRLFCKRENESKREGSIGDCWMSVWLEGMEVVV